MSRIIEKERKTAVLKRSSLACLKKLPTINITAGCVHQCIYCYANGYLVHPQDDTVVLYSNTLEKLKHELPRKRVRPSKVYFCPSCDLFQRVGPVLDLGYRILEYLLKENVGVAILTKGRIPDKHLALLCRYPENVEMQIGLICMDDKIRELFEPRAAGVGRRLAQIEAMTSVGVPVQVRADPILPGLSDSTEQFEALCEAISRRGVKTLAGSTLFLRPAIRRSLRKNLSGTGVYQRLVKSFEDEEPSKLRAENSPAVLLPVGLRRQIYGRLLRAAGRYGIQLNVCACKNPDLPDLAADCQITGLWDRARPVSHQQQTLF